MRETHKTKKNIKSPINRLKQRNNWFKNWHNQPKCRKTTWNVVHAPNSQANHLGRSL